jgi:myo-inositol 2-dehydrogenase/D-chiro-inositol 1-dehydrogenase
MHRAIINIGLIGAGRIGRLHAGHLAGQIPGARLGAVADVQLAAARELAAQHGVPVATADYGDLLADPTIDAVLIAAATDTHATIIAAAAAAGKHIFCEKPIALALPAIDAALAAVARAGVKLQIGFNRRFDANYRRVREAIVAGEIGRPEMLHIISRDPAPPPLTYLTTSGGLFLDMTIHDFDMARFLLGGEVTSVFATASALTDPRVAAAGDVDTAVTVLTFAGGAIATIENSRRAVYGYDQRVEVLGSAGSIATSNNYANTAIISDQGGIRRDPPLHFFMERYLASYRAELSAFAEAIRYDQPTPVGGADGRAPVILGLAAERSRREGRAVRPAEVEQALAQPTPA